MNLKDIVIGLLIAFAIYTPFGLFFAWLIVHIVAT